MGRLGLARIDLDRLELTLVDLGRLGSTWVVLTYINVSAECPMDALCKEDNRSVLYKRQKIEA
ncbi:hypothetical protein DPMN_004452 [Dreissena polymorpha]|uniref:Uncharacterized protein n=1 Tax=Dreissena polymorpha TaxID=45954 RepID=A0A9D4MQC8_DREPO|nr:hypothetical protein DPMN_004452 [Dreissena polymorpha]